MTATPQDRAARWLLAELDALDDDIRRRTESALKRRAGEDYTAEAIMRGLSLLKKRGHAETDPRWKLARLPKKAWRLTELGRTRAADLAAREAQRQVRQFHDDGA